MVVLIILAVIAGIVVLFLIALFLVALFERHKLEAFVPVPWESLPEPSPYFLAVNESARKLGFEYIGAYRVNRKSKLYGEYITLWLSSDHSTLARINGGKTLRVTARKTSLLSYRTDNRIIESTDYFLTRDLSGLTDKRLLLHAHFEELLAFHQQRLAAEPLPPRHIQPATAFRVYESLGVMKVTRMKELGLARFIDPGQTVWVYSLKGAMRVCGNLQTDRDEAAAQLERGKLKRPGDAA